MLYEFPLNEGTRTMLRLEQLLARLQTLVERDAALDHHFALQTLFEIMDVGSRADLKSDLLKELDRHRNRLEEFRGNPQISERPLTEALTNMGRAYDDLHASAGKVGQALANDEWLMAVRSRISIPAGTCSFDLPAYFAWQHASPAQRRADLQRWLVTLQPVAQALRVLLSMLRDSASAYRVQATDGVFQQRLPEGKTYHLLRLQMDPALQLVPEISGHRLMVGVRLMRQESDGRLKHATDNASFDLALCA
jgi:cell division protein ZapD